MKFCEVLEEMKKGYVAKFQKDELRAVKNVQQWRGEDLRHTWTLEVKREDNWEHLPSVNTQCTLSDDWVVVEDGYASECDEGAS